MKRSKPSIQNHASQAKLLSGGSRPGPSETTDPSFRTAHWNVLHWLNSPPYKSGGAAPGNVFGPDQKDIFKDKTLHKAFQDVLVIGGAMLWYKESDPQGSLCLLELLWGSESSPSKGHWAGEFSTHESSNVLFLG